MVDHVQGNQFSAKYRKDDAEIHQKDDRNRGNQAFRSFFSFSVLIKLLDDILTGKQAGWLLVYTSRPSGPRLSLLLPKKIS
jgi:hypothetical protein